MFFFGTLNRLMAFVGFSFVLEICGVTEIIPAFKNCRNARTAPVVWIFAEVCTVAHTDIIYMV